MNGHVVADWKEVACLLNQEEPGSVLRIPKRRLPHPAEGGARPSIGMPEGQSADFRINLSDSRCLHIRVFAGHYEAHLDHVDPASNLHAHMAGSPSRGNAAAWAGIGALVGLMVGGKKEGMVVGGLIGLVLGGLAVASSLQRNETAAGGNGTP